LLGFASLHILANYFQPLKGRYIFREVMVKVDFYELLSSREEFCCAIGRVMLSASKLEIDLKKYLRLHGKEVKERRATLGNLIKILRDNGHLTRNGEMHFALINTQRNYLIHNLYGSFMGEIDNALLPVDDLVEMDVETYIDRAQETAENLGHYSKIVVGAIEKYNKQLNRDKKQLASAPSSLL